MPTGDKKPDTLPIYGILVQLAVHGQENKWWMLYIFLTFNSFLLLSCAALFGVQEFSIAHRILLTAFCAAGTFIDMCWYYMAHDYVKASNLYSDRAVDAEAVFPEGLPKPFTERKNQRAQKHHWGTSEFVAKALPRVLIAIYATAVLLAWLRDT